VGSQIGRQHGRTSTNTYPPESLVWQGRPPLRIRDKREVWTSAEVILDEALGYGTYRFTLASPVDQLDPNAVLGLFTWYDDPAQANREIDIEFSRWGDPNRTTNANYVVQPYRDRQPPGRTWHPTIWASVAAIMRSNSTLTRSYLLGASSKNSDLAFRAVDPDPVAGADTRASVDRSDYRWESHFPSHDRSVARMTAMVGDDRSDEMQD